LSTPVSTTETQKHKGRGVQFVRTLLSLSSAHWVTSIGVVLTTASAVVFLLLLFQHFDNPYVGVVVFLILPALFVLGLLLMPLGLFLASRRAGGFRRILDRVPVEGARVARLAWAFAFATVANVGILTAAAYHGVGYMDSKEFCGVMCHSVMQPQYVRYQKSSHARVPCVDCHVGSGASSFVQYKLAGVRQLFRLSTRTYHRPIAPAMDRMRPASETCEHCHSRGSQDDKLKVIRHYDNDEKSTEKTTILLVRAATKIHKAHLERDIEYVSSGPDPQEIPIVTVADKTYALEDASIKGPKRRMDCMDCHNRSGHDFETPESAVDEAIAAGKLDRSRPFARRDAVAALKNQAGLEGLPEAVRLLLSENVFPNMSIGWGTYPNNIGHEKFPGCFRCHDGQHVTKAGESIGQDCGTCHELVAVDEQSPKMLKDLGLQ
jgi:nitrate/TMAO reductase-like tetraheme cytochrome c subunit